MSDDIVAEQAKDGLVYKKQYVCNHYYFNIDGDVGEPNEYREFINVLREANEGDQITLILNSHGGIVDSAVELFNYLMMTKANTVAEIYTAYSAASILALSCDQIIIGKFASILIHTMSSSTEGKTDDMKRQSDFLNDWNTDIIRDVYEGFLTAKEITQVLNGSEFWFLEKEILTRLKKWVPVRERLFKK